MVRAALEEARKTVAQCIARVPERCFFTSGGTESNNMAIKCSVRDLGVERIISSPTEHHCGLHTIETVQGMHGIEVVWLPVNELESITAIWRKHIRFQRQKRWCL
ncbi:MAG: aminotransferase class V-fold PLP-dependent enzyme [Saprospiraceae bacterium]